jgi:predicted MFS family arabinose efflux permease
MQSWRSLVPGASGTDTAPSTAGRSMPWSAMASPYRSQVGALCDNAEVTTPTSRRRRLPEVDWTVDVLGVLTIAVYGSWYYGFGVLIDDIADGLDMSATQLGISFGIAQVLLGVLSILTGRLLDRRGPSLVLGVVGPLGAILVGFAGRAAEPWQFIVCFALGGGISAAAGFYGMTQAIIVRLDHEAAMRRIIRLTIWGAFASPVAIPITEALRRHLGWRLAIELPAGAALVAFLVASRVVRSATPRDAAPTRTRWSSVMLTAVRDGAIRWHALGVMLTYMAMSTLLVFQLSIMRWAGLSAGVAAGFAGARGVLQLLGRLPLRRALDRVDAWNLLFAARGLVAIACLVILASGQVGFAGLYVLLAGAGIGAVSALDGIVGRDVLHASDFGALTGIVTLLGAIGGGVAPVVAGRVTDVTGSPAIAAMVAAVAGVGAMFALVAARRHRLARTT